MLVERWPLATAAAIAGGAWIGMSWTGPGTLPLVVALGGVAGALLLGRPAVLCLAAALLAGTLAQRSVAGSSPAVTGPMQAEVTLLTDPSPTPGGSVRAEVRWGRRHLNATAHQSAAAALDDRLAGERIIVRGQVQEPGPYERRMVHRHLVGRLRVDTVMGWRAGHGVTQAANDLRRTLERGAASLPEQQRALLMGLLLGDDRHQSPELTEAFQSAGLAHLLAVSGQNVAFVMTLAAPLSMRLRFAPRLVLSLALLAGFALLTRGEPSVLRATAMAGVASFGAATGRPTSSLRALAFAVSGLLLCDPLLVASLGFRLSVVGAAGIILAAGPIQARLPGPRWLTTPLAVTCGAQLAVAPLLVAAFGSVALASLPANLLALPAAGPLTMWGLTGGLAAGVVGEPFAAVLQGPNRVLLAWIELVARNAAVWPLGAVRAGHLVGLLAAGLMVGLGRRFGSSFRWAGSALAVTVLGAAVMSGSTRAPPQPQQSLGAGVVLWRGGGAAVLVVDGRATEAAVVSGLHRAGVRRIDLAVVSSAATKAVALGRWLRARWPAGVVLAPEAVVSAIPGAVTPPAGGVLDVGGMRLRFETTAERIDVNMRSP